MIFCIQKKTYEVLTQGPLIINNENYIDANLDAPDNDIVVHYNLKTKHKRKLFINFLDMKSSYNVEARA